MHGFKEGLSALSRSWLGGGVHFSVKGTREKKMKYEATHHTHKASFSGTEHKKRAVLS